MDKIVILDTLNFVYKGAIKFKTEGVVDKNEPDFTLVYNFFRNLRALVEKLNPTKIFAAREGKNAFRYKLFSDYKANRLVKFASKTKEEVENFNRQKEIIYSLMGYLPITSAYNDNYEADDVIYSLCDNLKDEECVIVSNDSDLQQILQKSLKNVKIYNPFKKEYVVAPKHFVLIWKALAGDKSDNIPGVVEQKQATILVNDPEKLKVFLEKNNEARIQFNDNIELIRLRLIQPEDLVFIDHQVSYAMLKNEFQNMKFDSLIRADVWPKFVDTFKGISL